MTAPITGTPPASTQLPASGTGSKANPLAGLNDTLTANDFLQLLVAQMTHQDPTAPTDDTQMASQLAQFASLSQLTNINTTLTGQGSSTNTLATSVNNAAALNLIGKSVTASSSQIAVGTNGTTSVSTTVPASGGDLVLKITDANGNVVGTKDVGQVAPGAQSVQLAALTNGLASGTYNVQFTLTDATGAVTNPATMITTKVDGVTFAATGAEATSGSLTIPIGSIASVTSN